MGKYDDIRPETLREALVCFAEVLIDLNAQGTLLERGPEVQKMLGDLRRMLFAYEVRCTERLPIVQEAAENQEEEQDPVVARSLRIVREAVKRESDIAESWRNGDSGGGSEVR